MRTRALRSYRLVIEDNNFKIVLGDDPPSAAGDARKLIAVKDPNGNLLFDVHQDGTMSIGGGENTHSVNGVNVQSVLEVHSEGGSSPAGLTIHNHADTTALGSEITFFRSRGTHISPAVVTNGSVIGRISAFPFDGADHTYGGLIGFYIDGTVGVGNTPTAIVFATAAASQINPLERMRIKPTGEIIFKNSGALAHACLHGYDVNSPITFTGTGKANKVQILAFSGNGPYSPSTVPDHTQDHITVGVTGRFKIDAHIGVKSAAGTGFLGGFSAYKNNGATEITNLHAHHDFVGGGGDSTTIPLSGIVDLTSGDTLEVWTWNETNTTGLVINEITMNIFMVGAA